MDKIDWSKAPGWANKLGINPHGEKAWLGDGGYSYLIGTGGGFVSWHSEMAFSYTAFGIIESRPVVWGGEGLPPVGTVCEVRFPEDDCPKWEKVIVVFSGYRFIAVKFEDGDLTEFAHRETAAEFRPIRTAEQIAAEERDKFVEQMRKDLGWKEEDCAMAWAKGYRKQEAK